MDPSLDKVVHAEHSTYISQLRYIPSNIDWILISWRKEQRLLYRCMARAFFKTRTSGTLSKMHRPHEHCLIFTGFDEARFNRPASHLVQAFFALPKDCQAANLGRVSAEPLHEGLILLTIVHQ